MRILAAIWAVWMTLAVYTLVRVHMEPGRYDFPLEHKPVAERRSP